jgi:DNA-binding transcriptional MocR family regulator
MSPVMSLERLKPSYIREILQIASQKNVLSFAGGLPEQDSFPLKLMQQSFASLVSNTELFQYSRSSGYQPLIDFLKQEYDTDNDRDLMITNGSQQGLDLIARAYINPGDKVVVESPSYLGALQVFELAQAEVISVSQLQSGPDLVELEQIFQQQVIKIFYIIADFHNPTGISYDVKTRYGIARLCHKYQVTLIEDAPYRELRFRGEQLPLVASYNPQNTIVVRSFSKIACPGLRIGVVEACRDVIRQLLKVKQVTDLQTNTPLQYVLLHLLQHQNYRVYLEGVRQNYKRKHDLMLEQLILHLGKHIDVSETSGGMFLWVKINSQFAIDMLDLTNTLLTQGVAVVPGQVFQVDQANPCCYLRLNFSHPCEDDIEQGVLRLSKVVRDFVGKAVASNNIN